MSQVQVSPHVRQVADLNRRIGEYEKLRATVIRRLIPAKHAAAGARLKYTYCRIQSALRTPTKSFNLWPLGVMMVGPLLVAGPAFAATQIQSGSLGMAIAAFAVAAGVGAAIFACLLFVPGGNQLEQVARAASHRRQTIQQQAEAITTELSRVDHTLRNDRKARDGILKSVQYQRELLLQQNWKAMRGSEFEAFLADVFHLLGGVVEARGATGDQGVDLIIELGNRRYAIQVKGYVSSVGNGAVQEVVAGMAHCQCTRCAVITNSRYTSGAIALAASNRCLLIGEDEIADLVLGRLVL